MTQAEERLKQLEAQQEKMNAQIQLVKNRVSEEKRKHDTRRKILLGAAVLKQLEAGHLQHDDVNRWLDALLTRDTDRMLFNLPPKEGALS